MWSASPRDLALAGFLSAAAAFSAALISQYGFGLQPCPLCIWQRVPYVIGGAAALAGLLFFSASSTPARWAFGFAALSFLVGAGLAVFHSGVEFGFWEGFASCSAPDATALSADDLLKRLEGVSLVRCDDRQPFFLGLTMANWNVMVCLFIAACFAAAAQGARLGAAKPAVA